MIKKTISLIVLILVLLNIPTIVLETQSIAISSPISYFLFLLLAILVAKEKSKFPKELNYFAFTTILYFVISAFNYEGPIIIILFDFIKSILYLFGLFISFKYVNKNLFIIILLIGASTIILDSLYFRFNDFSGDGYTSEYGRYAGFYLNPNIASVICLLGYALSLNLKGNFKIIAIVFAFLGILTLSRSFIITFVLVSAVYFYYNKKVVFKSVFVLILGIICLISYSTELKLDSSRFGFVTGLFMGDINQEVLKDDSRHDQWAKFYDPILNSPLIGNGYGSFSQSLDRRDQGGVHNVFLLIFGESGFAPFLLSVALFIWLFYSSFRIIRLNILPFLLTIILFITFLVSHNFFNSGIYLIVFTFIIYLLNQDKNKLLNYN
jgi:O-antigen ligase